MQGHTYTHTHAYVARASIFYCTTVKTAPSSSSRNLFIYLFLSFPPLCLTLACLSWLFVFLRLLYPTRSDRSIAYANRPERRAVFDRERQRAVAEKQAEASEATNTANAKKNH